MKSFVHKMRESLEKLIPVNMGTALILTLTMNGIAYFVTRLFTTGLKHYDFSLPIDHQIPLVSWTVAIYYGCFAFWGLNYILGCRQDEEEAFHFISADFFAKLICMLCFIFIPTTMERPEVIPNGLWDQIIVWLYHIDAADNLLPSIHCLCSWFCFIAVRKNPRVPVWYKVFSAVFAIVVFISTLTTRQHLIVDVITGFALAEFAYWFVHVTGFDSKYSKIVKKIRNIIVKYV